MIQDRRLPSNRYPGQQHRQRTMAEFENDTFVEEGGEGPRGLPSRLSLQPVLGMQVIICLVGIVGNALVLYIYGRRGERLTYVTGILALAVKDLICCSVFIPFCITMEANDFLITSDFFCKLFHFLGNMMAPIVILILTLLALDRVVCLLKSHIQATYQKRAVVAVMIVVVFAMGISLLPMLAVGVYEKRPLRTTGSNNTGNSFELVNRGACRVNGITVSLKTAKAYSKFIEVVLLLPTMVIVVAYLVIFGAFLYRKYAPDQPIIQSPLGGVGNKPGDSTSSDLAAGIDCNPPSGATDNEVSEDRQLALLRHEQWSVTALLFTVTLVFYITIFPAMLMAYRHVRLNLILYYLHQLHYASNPIVYVCLDRSFRKELREMFHSGWSRFTQ